MPVRTRRRRRSGRRLAAALLLLAVAVTALALALPALEPAAPPAPSEPERSEPLPPSPAPPAAGLAEDVRYVSSSGSDEAPGTEDAPWRTVAHALSEDRPGTRILVREGTYEEEIDASPEGEPGRPMVIEAHPGERAVYEGQWELDGARHLRVSGLVFDGEDTSGTAIRISGGEDVEFSQNEVTGYRGGESAQGFLLTDGALRTRIVANRIHDLGTWTEHDHGIYCRSADAAYLANNLVYGLDQGSGIHLYDADGEGCDDARVVANTIVGNQTSGIVVSRGADRNVIAGNVIAGHTKADNPSYGHAVRDGEGVGEGNVVRHNLGWDNAQERDFACDACEQSANQEGDPRFLDPDAGDFRLGAGSAALGGLPAPLAPARDFAGVARGRTADRGALEARRG